MRIGYLLALGCAVFLSLTANANAVAEFCPARLAISPSGGSVAAASRLYGFELTAQGPRSVTAILAFDTDAGWFKATVPPVTIGEKERHYTSPWAAFVRRDWVSPVIYVQFPKAVVVKHDWVKTAQASGDDLGWAAKGPVECLPTSSPAFSPGPRALG